MKNTLLKRVKRGPNLLKAVRGKERVMLVGYLIQNFLNQILKLPVSAHEMTLTMNPGIRVSVQTFSSQLGAYLDIFHEFVYGQLPRFLGQPGQVIIDAGAHVGFYTLWQAASVGPTGQIYAFEPNPTTYAFLEKNVKQNGLDWVQCMPQALSVNEGALIMKAVDRATSSTRVLYDAPDTTTPTISVQSTTLDIFVERHNIQRIDILKMDTEGAEVDIIQGGIQQALPITERVIMESHSVRFSGEKAMRTRELVRDLLLPLGFRLSLDYQNEKIVYFERVP